MGRHGPILTVLPVPLHSAIISEQNQLHFLPSLKPSSVLHRATSYAKMNRKSPNSRYVIYLLGTIWCLLKITPCSITGRLRGNPMRLTSWCACDVDGGSPDSEGLRHNRPRIFVNSAGCKINLPLRCNYITSFLFFPLTAALSEIPSGAD